MARKNRKNKNQMAMRNLALLPVNNNVPVSNQKPNNVNINNNQNVNNIPSSNREILKKPRINLEVNHNSMNSNQGHNVKRVMSSKMYSTKSKNGKEETMIDILSGVSKNKKSRILRHFRVTRDGKKKSSTVLAKSNGKKIKVLESVQNGDVESVRKYKVKNPDEFKNVLSVQTNEIKGENMIKTMNLPTQPTKTETNTQINRKSLINPVRKITKKNPLQFKKMRDALQKSLKSIMKPRPSNQDKNKKFGKQMGDKNRNRNRNRNKNRRSKKRKQGK